MEEDHYTSSDYDTDDEEKQRREMDTQNEMIDESRNVMASFVRQPIIELLKKTNRIQMENDNINNVAEQRAEQIAERRVNHINIEMPDCDKVYNIYLDVVDCDYVSKIRNANIAIVHNTVRKLIDSVYLYASEIEKEFNIPIKINLHKDTIYLHYNDQYRIGIICNEYSFEEFTNKFRNVRYN